MSVQESLPRPVPIGINYYVLRRQDYIARHGIASQPPDYYLAYGNKYCRRFRLDTRRQFSPLGQAWIDRTCDLLQQALEWKRAEDPGAFARLEENHSAFRSLAYSQHALAYIQGGIAALPLRDLGLILCLIDVKDLVTRDGLSQMSQVLVYLGKTYCRRAFDFLKVLVLRGALAFLEMWFTFWQSAISMNYLPQSLQPRAPVDGLRVTYFICPRH